MYERSRDSSVSAVTRLWLDTEVSVCDFRLGHAFPSISGYRGGGYFRRHKVSGYEAIVSPASNAGLGMH
jgi:hypothetical protein